MQTFTIDIINKKAIKLIQDMELLDLIHIRKEKDKNRRIINWDEKYKGTMQKQPHDEIENQLKELRNSWE